MEETKDSDKKKLPPGVQARFAERALQMSSEHHGRYFSMGNWILATLVAINGAAIAALTNLEIALLKQMLIPGTVFVAGVIAAVLSGLCHKAEMDRLSGVRFIEGVFEFQSEKVPEDMLKDRSEYIRLAARSHRASKWLSVASLMLFAAGCLAAGYEVAQYEGNERGATTTHRAQDPRPSS